MNCLFRFIAHILNQIIWFLCSSFGVSYVLELDPFLDLQFLRITPIPPFCRFFFILLTVFCLCLFLQNAIGILTGITLNLQISLGGMSSLRILILPIQEHWIYFPFLVQILFNFFHQWFIIFLIEIYLWLSSWDFASFSYD